jgi:hypothetical protein
MVEAKRTKRDEATRGLIEGRGRGGKEGMEGRERR